MQSGAPKFDDYVKTSDRKELRKMLDIFLPWPLMEPVEASIWKNWLDVFEHPDPKRTSLVFRGLNDGAKLVTTKENGQKATYNFSAVLAHNQGSYNRRLLSLQTMRETIWRSQDVIIENDVYKLPPSIFKAMNIHSRDPLKSPWLSTSDINVARNFGSKRMGAYLLDERLLIPNFNSQLASEHELLSFLVLLPDDMVADTSIEPDQSSALRDFQAIVERKIGRRPSPRELGEDFRERTWEHFKTMVKKLNEYATQNNLPPACLSLRKKTR